jgi:hypothetical protein
MPSTLFDLCAAGIRRSRCLLPLLAPLALQESEAVGGLGPAVGEPQPSAPLICGVPAYTIDGYTRAGRLVLAHLGREEPNLKAILKALSPSTRLPMLHHLLFCVEGGCCSPRLVDPLAQTLGRFSETLGLALHARAIPDALAAMRAALPVVHALRADVLARHQLQE